jgi:hypothetical protein
MKTFEKIGVIVLSISMFLLVLLFLLVGVWMPFVFGDTPAFSGMLFIGFLYGLLVLLIVPFWIWMLVDCSIRKFDKLSVKIIWLLVLIFLQFIGSIVYYFVVKRAD